MEVKENGDVHEDSDSSPDNVLPRISEDAVKLDGVQLHSAFLGNPGVQPSGLGHRRARSEVVTSGCSRPNTNFQRWKTSVQRAFRWGSNSQDQTFFNPEILANQKRQWYQLHSKSLGRTTYKEPSSLFEHFIIAGIHPDANLEVVEDAFAKRKKWETQVDKSDFMDYRMMQYRSSIPTLEPQILFKYPPGKRLAMRLKDLAAFCFPGGVKARVLERTPSLSDLNEHVYGQGHLSRDDSSFIFSLKVADNATLYGVCLHVQEFVQRPPAIFGSSSPLSHSTRGSSRFLVSAPRCYCLLTRVPFFELHYAMLNSIIAQERLNRITQFLTEINLTDDMSKYADLKNENADSPNQEGFTQWMSSAIPVDSAISLAATAAGILSDEGSRSSSARWESYSPNSVSSDGSYQAREMDRDGVKTSFCCDDYSSDALEKHSDCLGSTSGRHENVSLPGSDGHLCPGRRILERIGSSDSLFSKQVGFFGSSVRSVESEDEDDEIFYCCDKDAGVEMIMEWAKENRNDLLQIVCYYHATPLPSRGGKIVFKPLEHLQAIEYRRPAVSNLCLSEDYLDLKMQNSLNSAELAASEEAAALSTWTVATVCRVLSLENVLALVTGVLLEKQVVIVCSNLGILSATVLSVIPLILPFEWQSLFLPVLPGKMFDFLDAPVPYVVGIQHKPSDLKMKTSNLVQVNLAKNQVKMCSLPTLPRQKELISELGPVYARLSSQRSSRKHPVYKCTEVQGEAAAQFLAIMRQHLGSFCSDLSPHTITSVQSNHDRVSILLKDSYIDSFPSKDQPFIKLFVETQLFMVLSDSKLSRYENGYYN